MNEPQLVQQQRSLLHQLTKLIADRAHGESTSEAAYVSSAEDARAQLRAAKQMLQRFKHERAAAEKEYRETRERLTVEYRHEYETRKNEFSDLRDGIEERYNTEKKAAKDEYREARWTTKTVCEAAKGAALDGRTETTLDVSATQHELLLIQQRATDYLRSIRQKPVFAKVAVTRTPVKAQEDAIARVEECKASAEDMLAELHSLALPRVFKGLRPGWLVLGIFVLAIYPAGFLLGLPENPVAWAADWLVVLGAAGAAALAIGISILVALYYSARAQLVCIYQPLRQAVYDGELLKRHCEAQANRVYEREVAKCQHKRDLELGQAVTKYHQRRDKNKQQAVEQFRKARQEYQPLLQKLTRDIAEALKGAGEKYRRRRQTAREGYRVERQRMVDNYLRAKKDAKARIQQERDDLNTHWQQGLAEVREGASDVNVTCSVHFTDWTESVWNHWQPPGTVPHALRFGEFRASLDRLHRDAANKEWVKQEEALLLPALIPFPHSGSVLLKVTDAGRANAVQALQNIMMRYLTSLPPGKVRFTIIDPVGLGENFAAFMHLADHDEQLVTSRIWTEQAHIEQRLADLTAHMENVIQKYLRNQFETIEDYNVHAGEVAEPYRVLVIANFPANFTPEAARRLLSIAGTGARCGVYTLISVDMKQRLPEGTDFNLSDLEEAALNLEWDGTRFRWKDKDFGPFPLFIDPPPTSEFCTRILQVVGARAKELKRVEVPFEFIAPTSDQWWTGDTRPGLSVPLGRAGATKRQHLRLGHGTAQHVLIAGKTGSGKSTLLHALITNAALLYSPDELELYLVDFKKGVEFKTYAMHELPHARIVAIESEREFGLSVLQRLDAELKSRADRFRELGAQDLAAYRNSNGVALQKPCPRILFIVDEFQEFFVEDDKIAQDSALLLDRLVRQGRAFGIHVLLGSQTLGGAYTLARSTIDQMAVRIALQCSEADGHIILSEDNSAARLLSRPGEAIYNDANGLVEGNDPFQIVWLADEKREFYLEGIHAMAAKRIGRPLPQIVFEGNAPADLRRNDLLHQALTTPEAHPSQRVSLAWLGEAIAIKEPTCAIFRQQSGSNLLVLGQQEDASIGIFTTAILSLAAQLPPAESLDHGLGVRFCVLDGTGDDSPHAGHFRQLGELLPHGIQVAGWRDTTALVAELSAELDRRQQAHGAQAPSVYLIVQGLQRFRDLRRSEDDFGMSRDEAVSPAKQFAGLLRDGPGFGIHVLVWCDTLNNLQRTLERIALREFEIRVLFQMGAADSSNLIDSPLASKLGLHRALFYSEEQGKLEKFRPYGVPSKEWLDWAAAQLRERKSAEAVAAVAT